MLGILAAFSLIVGVFWLAEGWGVLNGKGWAWTVGIIILALSIINSILQVAFGNFSSLVGLVINLLIVYYLTRPHVKAFFGKGTGSTLAAAKM